LKLENPFSINVPNDVTVFYLYHFSNVPGNLSESIFPLIILLWLLYSKKCQNGDIRLKIKFVPFQHEKGYGNAFFA
jgi:hypothetical protein